MLARASRSGATATAIDAAIAGAATVGVQQAVWSGQIAGRSVLLAALFLPATVALFWRRRAPSAFLVLFFSAFAIQGASTGDAPEGAEFVLPILVGLYSLGAYGTRREALIAWPVVVVGSAVHDLNDLAFSNDPWAGAFWWLVSVAA